MAFDSKKNQYISIVQSSAEGSASDSADSSDVHHPAAEAADGVVSNAVMEQHQAEDPLSASGFDMEARLSEIEDRVRLARERIRRAYVEEISAPVDDGVEPQMDDETDTTASSKEVTSPIEPVAFDAPGEYDPFEYFDDDSVDPLRAKHDERVSEGESSFEDLLFGKPPISIEESMLQAETQHNRRRWGLVLVMVFSCMILAATAVTLFGSLDLNVRELSVGWGDAKDSASSANQDEESLAADLGGETDSESVREDGSSSAESSVTTTLIRHYRIDCYGEKSLEVREAVEFGVDDLCEKTTVRVAFSSVANAEAFCADIRDIHEDDCIEAYVDGQTGVVVIDISDLNKTKQEYASTAGGVLLGLTRL